MADRPENSELPVCRIGATPVFAEIDPVLARIIESVGPCRVQLRADGTHFQALTRAIVFQQLSGKAAGTI